MINDINVVKILFYFTYLTPAFKFIQLITRGKKNKNIINC